MLSHKNSIGLAGHPRLLRAITHKLIFEMLPQYLETTVLLGDSLHLLSQDILHIHLCDYQHQRHFVPLFYVHVYILLNNVLIFSISYINIRKVS